MAEGTPRPPSPALLGRLVDWTAWAPLAGAALVVVVDSAVGQGASVAVVALAAEADLKVVGVGLMALEDPGEVSGTKEEEEEDLGTGLAVGIRTGMDIKARRPLTRLRDPVVEDSVEVTEEGSRTGAAGLENGAGSATGVVEVGLVATENVGVGMVGMGEDTVGIGKAPVVGIGAVVVVIGVVVIGVVVTGVVVIGAVVGLVIEIEVGEMVGLVEVGMAGAMTMGERDNTMGTDITEAVVTLGGEGTRLLPLYKSPLTVAFG